MGVASASLVYLETQSNLLTSASWRVQLREDQGNEKKRRRRKEKGERREILKERKGKVVEGSIERKTRKEETKSGKGNFKLSNTKRKF